MGKSTIIYTFALQHGKSYEQIKKELRDENAGISFVQEELTKFSFDRKYPFSVLCQEELPEGIDPTRKEV